MEMTLLGHQRDERVLEQFALPCACEERVPLVKMLFATRQNLQTNSKDALVEKMTEEIFDVCDEYDQVIGQATRAEVHARGLLHRAVHIWIWRSDGRLMVHLRSETKDQFPNCYTSSASGHLDTGEDYEQAAHRELKEELDLAGELTWSTKLPASSLTANEHSVLFEMITDEIPKPDPGEIAEVEYLTLPELRQLLDREPDNLTPPFRALLEWWFDTQD